MRHRQIASVTLAIATALLTAVCPKTVHAGNCKIPALSGEYGLAINGYISFSSATPPLSISKFSPISVSGTVGFSNTGKVDRSVQVNVGGAVFPVVDSGTYVLNPDCTLTVNHGNGEVWTVTPVKGGAELEFSVTSVPGAVGVGAGTMVLKGSK